MRQRKGLHEYYNMGTKILIFFSRKFEIEFDLCWRAEINIQVGLTSMSTSGMHRRPFEGRHLVINAIPILFSIHRFILFDWNFVKMLQAEEARYLKK